MHHDHVMLDAFVVMPNHIHGIIFITDYGDLETENVETLHATSLRGNQLSETEYFSAISPKKGSLFENVRSFKSSVLKLIHSEHSPALAWQPIFYDCVLCADQDMENLRLNIDLKSVN